MPSDTFREIHIIDDKDMIETILDTIPLTKEDKSDVSIVALISNGSIFSHLWVARSSEKSQDGINVYEKVFHEDAVVPVEQRETCELQGIWNTLAALEGLPVEAASPI